MPLVPLRRGRVTAIVERHEGLVRLEVDGEPCVAYPRLTGPVALGDEVLVNEQARALALGSGGFDVLHANLTRGLGLAPAEGAHVMKLPYTPAQAAWPHGEEAAELAESLDGMPVVCCSLHSQVAPVCAGLAGARVAYVQLPGGALPVSLSDSVRELKERGLLGAAVAAGACFDGDVECVGTPSALAWTRAKGYDVAVCAIGPGVVGTASRLGHGGLAAAEAANAASALGGTPVLAVRVSGADERERHRGVSHHTRTALELCLGPVRVAWPRGLDAPEWLADRDEVDVEDWRDACGGLPLDHMGRGPDEDPWFFAAAFAAGRLARAVASADGGAAARARGRPRHLADVRRGSRNRARSRRRGARRRVQRLFDTSPMYGAAERSLGAALGERADRRSSRRRSGRATRTRRARQYAEQLAWFGGRVDDRAGAQPRRVGAHLPWLEHEREEGRIERIGVTHYASAHSASSHGRSAPADSTRCSCRSTRSSATASASCCRLRRSWASP